MVHAGAERSDSQFCCVCVIPGFGIRTVTLRQEADAQRPGWFAAMKLTGEPQRRGQLITLTTACRGRAEVRRAITARNAPTGGAPLNRQIATVDALAVKPHLHRRPLNPRLVAARREFHSPICLDGLARGARQVPLGFRPPPPDARRLQGARSTCAASTHALRLPAYPVRQSARAKCERRDRSDRRPQTARAGFAAAHAQSTCRWR